MTPLLRVEDLKKNYGTSVQALRGVSFAVEEGEFVALIGVSGSGKSTLLRCINRLIRHSSGGVFFRGAPVADMRGRGLRRLRRHIGMIFQHYNLIDRSNVLQNVLHGRLGYMSDLASILNLYSRQDRLLAYRMLERVGLEAEIYKRADQLSGGQKQRVGISRALVQKPDIVLADEPIASLDPATAATVMDYLHNICREEGIAAIVSLHQVEFALKYASRIIGLRRGEIVYDGSPAGLSRGLIDAIYDKNREPEPFDMPAAVEAVT